MTINARRRLAAPLLAITFCVAAFADLSEITVLDTNNAALNFDTGAVGPSGGDLAWNRESLTPQGAAKVRNLGTMGATAFDTLGASFFTQQAAGARNTPLTPDLLVPGDVFVVVTNGGHTAKAMVIVNSRSALSIRFTTYGVAASGAPAITGILNNSSAMPLSLPGSGIAPSSLFLVKGSSLADAGAPVLQSSESPGLPSTLNGVSLTVVVNGVTTHPALYYTSPAQLAAVLPAATPTGSGTLTVTYRGQTSAPAPITVVPSAVGINSYYTNSGVATDAVSGALLTFTNSASPGETIVLWATGLGANPADSDATFTTTPHPVSTPLEVYIGGISAPILYQGSSGYPGVNQINVTIPQAVPTGCWVSMIAITGAVVSNAVTLPIRNGGGPCLDAPSGLTGNQIAPSGSQTLKAGLVSVIQTNTPASRSSPVSNSADAAFVKYTGLYAPAHSVSPGGCIVGPVTPSPIPNVTGLDVGTMTLTGPSGSPITMRSQGIKGTFFTDLQTNGVPASGGKFTFTASGGADVAAFTATVNFSGPLLNWTNQSAAVAIDRTKPLTVTWTGGNPGSYVFITGTSGAGPSATGPYGYTCMATADDGKFTVPSYVFLAMPAGAGATEVQNSIQSPLSANGIDVGVAIGTVSYSVSSTYTTGGSGGIGK
jgi:uncharacterized protein (TIGR03437 family)